MIYGDFSKNGPEVTAITGGSNVACAIYESTLSDMAMFNAMLKVDAYDIKLNEAEAEGKVDAETAKKSKGELAKGVAHNLIDKIASAFEWLADKIVAAYQTIKGKLISLLNDDTKMIAKYEKAVLAQKDKVNGIAIKWYNLKAGESGSELASDTFKSSFGVFNETEALKMYSDNASKRREAYFTAKESDYFRTESPESTTIGAVGGIDSIVSYLKNTGRKNIESHSKIITQRSVDMRRIAKGFRNKKNAFGTEDAAKIYKMYQAYKDCTLKSLQVVQNCLIKVYKQNKAAFTRAVGSLAKTESTILEFIVSEAMFAVDDAMESSFAEAAIFESAKSIDGYEHESANLDFFGQPIF